MWEFLQAPISASFLNSIPSWVLVVAALVLFSGAGIGLMMARPSNRPPVQDFGTRDPEDERARDRRFIDSL